MESGLDKDKLERLLTACAECNVYPPAPYTELMSYCLSTLHPEKAARVAVIVLRKMPTDISKLLEMYEQTQKAKNN